MDDLIRDTVALIERAFPPQNLGDGTGLLEAIALDTYSDPREARVLDEKQDWRLIMDETLNELATSMCFMNLDGKLFHFPAYLSFTLRRYHDFTSVSGDIATNLLKDAEILRQFHGPEKHLQREAIKASLTACRQLYPLEFEHEPIELIFSALAGNEKSLRRLEMFGG